MKNKLNKLLVVLSSTTAIGLGYYVLLYFINNGISIFNNYIKGSKFNNNFIILRKVNIKFYNNIIIMLGLLLINIILLNYYISFELNSHLDDYIRVHNHILGIKDNWTIIGESSSKASIIVESIIPLFIINKYNKIPKIIKRGFVFIILGSFYYFFIYYNINLNIFMHDNIKYIVGLFILFDLWVLSFTLESVIIIYYLNYTDSLLENKIYKLLPNSLKNEISSSKEFNQKEIHTYYIKMILHCIIILTVLIIAEIGFYILINY